MSFEQATNEERMAHGEAARWRKRAEAAEREVKRLERELVGEQAKTDTARSLEREVERLGILAHDRGNTIDRQLPVVRAAVAWALSTLIKEPAAGKVLELRLVEAVEQYEKGGKGDAK